MKKIIVLFFIISVFFIGCKMAKGSEIPVDKKFKVLNEGTCDTT